jgi:hypothetical protein
MSFGGIIVSALQDLAAPASIQRSIDFPPEELRLGWEDAYAVLAGDRPDLEAVASFDGAELAAMRRFNDWMWSLPPEPDPMWDRANLDAPPWPEVRARASALLALLEGSPLEA